MKWGGFLGTVSKENQVDLPVSKKKAIFMTLVGYQDQGMDKRNLSVYSVYTQWRCGMRTNVVIDDKLMSRALRLSGCRTKRSAIESGLRLLVQMESQKKLRTLRGMITWDGDLEEMRRD